MGTYKVPQNVEAEDKILGPLSLKQFIYALIGVGYGLLTFAIFKPISIVIWVFIGLPPMLALLGLGLYQREDQPLEVFVVAMAQYFVRPRLRFWQKEPIAEVFRLEPPPPKPEAVLRDPRLVRSQLAQLADVVDTRGWSIKEPELQESDEQPVVDLQGRLGAETLSTLSLGSPLSEPSTSDVTDEDDILSTQSESAHKLNLLIENTVKSVREEALENMKARAKLAPTAPAPQPVAAIMPSPSAAALASATPSISSSTAAPSGAILKIAQEGGDLTVAQVAAQARRYYENTLAEGESVSLRHAESTAA